MAGSFAVFEALGIEETFDVSNSVFNPQYLQFLGINVLDYQVPGDCYIFFYELPCAKLPYCYFFVSFYNLAKPGDWVNGEWQKDRDENRSEHEVINRLIQKLFTSTSHDLYDSLFDDLKLAIEKPSTLDVLFKKIKYHFINQHPLIKFNEFPEDDKIVYIGGILVEDDKLLTETKKKEDNEFYCHVLVSFGTMEYLVMYPISTMIEQVFVKFPQCHFHVRATGNSKFRNGYTSKEPLPQKEILSQTNTRVFISHCGINSVNESMYAGVPLICIPFTGDQLYNASIIEANGVGVYLKLNDIHFMKNLENSLNQILNIDDAGNCNFNSEYSSEAKKKRNEILQNYEHETMEKNFLDKF
uniref:glucuronosyltransferase n=1 Tax=Meloidogyne enterolobii TaxID=390850 RepID=A0A6V7WJV7_MELEN|nr:unnamed protein product [Meloidogyne enterolobii]